MRKMLPVKVSAPTFSLDLLPTLCNLFGVEFDSRLYPGRDVFSDAEAIVFDGGYDWKTELGTYIASKNQFTPVSDKVEIPEDYVSRIRTIVKNKYSFCKGALADDYYGHVYETITGEKQPKREVLPEDNKTQEENPAAAAVEENTDAANEQPQPAEEVVVE